MAESPGRGHETADVDERSILRVGAALLAVVLLAALVVWWLARELDALHTPHASISSREQPLAAFPAPRLEPAPLQDIAALRAQKQAMLNGYRWIDRGRGIVQIPIERAMRLLAARAASGEQAAPAAGAGGGR